MFFALPRMRSMSVRLRSLRVACDSVTAAGVAPKLSRRLPSTTDVGEATAALKKASAAGQTTGSTSRVCFSALGFTARSSGHSTASQMIAMDRTAAMHASEPQPVRIDFLSFPPPSAPRSSSSWRYVSSEPS